MVPLDSLVTLIDTSGPQVISHYNLFRSGGNRRSSSAPGISTGAGPDGHGTVGHKNTCCGGMQYSWTGLAEQEIEAGNKAIIILGLGILVVYLDPGRSI